MPTEEATLDVAQREALGFVAERALRGGPPWPAVAAIGASAILVAIHANLPLLGLVLLYEARLDELIRSPTLHSECAICECHAIPVGPWSFHGVLSGAQGGTWLRTDCSGDGLIGIDTLSTGLAHAPNPEHSPFGTAQYRLEHLVGPWYTFEASDDY